MPRPIPLASPPRRLPLRLGLTLAVLCGALAAPAAAWAARGASADAAAVLPAPVRAALARAGVPADAVAIEVASLPATASAPTAPRLAWRVDAAMNPASVMKLVTTYAALDLLGPDYTWTNRVELLGPLQGGVLQGDLLLRGSGDPKLVLERLDALLRAVVAAGVREVRGDIVLDGRVFELPDRDPAAFDAEPLRPYNATPDGLLVNFKSLLYTFSPDPAAGVARVRFEPPIAGVAIPDRVPLAAGPCADWRASLGADFSDPTQVRFAGSYPAACGERTWPVAYAAPAQFAPRVVQALWAQAGGVLVGRVRWAAPDDMRRGRELLAAPSLPLGEVVADINKFSNNVMAQQVFLTLSAVERLRGTFAASRERVQRWWRGRFGAAPLVLDNGSGLSREERTSAAALTQLLHEAASGPLAAPFTGSLGVAGVDGTVARLRERAPDSPVIGRAWLKTGSLRDVASIAGYVEGESGRRYSVVALINHPNAGAARPALDAVLDWTARDLPRASAAHAPSR